MPISGAGSVDLFNRAGALVGLPPVSSLDGAGEAVYQQVAYQVLTWTDWGWCRRHEQLVELAETPPQPYERVFRLPTPAGEEVLRLLRVWTTDGRAPLWSYGSDGALYTRGAYGDVWAEYTTARPPVHWPEPVKAAFVALLAAELAGSSREDPQLASYHFERGMALLRKAVAADRTPLERPRTPWVEP